MGPVLARSIGAAAACAVFAAAPAIAGDGHGGGGHDEPEIQSISYSQAESGATLIEAGVKRAKRVSVGVGQGGKRERDPRRHAGIMNAGDQGGTRLRNPERRRARNRAPGVPGGDP